MSRHFSFLFFCIFVCHFCNLPIFSFCLLVCLCFFLFLVSEVDELFPEEEVCIREVVNHSTHAYLDLVTLKNLRRFGFGPNPGSPPFLFFILFVSSGYDFFPVPFFLFFIPLINVYMANL